MVLIRGILGNKLFTSNELNLQLLFKFMYFQNGQCTNERWLSRNKPMFHSYISNFYINSGNQSAITYKQLELVIFFSPGHEGNYWGSPGFAGGSPSVLFIHFQSVSSFSFQLCNVRSIITL